MTGRVLIIAGSDSSGGAGIQADIKAVTMLDAYAATAITAVTVQNTCGVRDVLAMPPELVVAQIDAVASDIGIDAAKTGMLATAPIVAGSPGRTSNSIAPSSRPAATDAAMPTASPAATGHSPSRKTRR